MNLKAIFFISVKVDLPSLCIFVICFSLLTRILLGQSGNSGIWYSQLQYLCPNASLHTGVRI